GEIEMLVNEKNAFIPMPDQPANTFVEYIDRDCRSDITIPDIQGNPSVGTYTIRDTIVDDCQEIATVQVGLDASDATLPAGTGTGSSSSGTMEDTCESMGGAWGWILCSGIDLIDGALNFVDNQIQRLLEVNEDRYTNSTLREAWVIFRNLAYIILIPVMLV